MGFSTELFVDPVDKNLICPICLEVLDSPQILQCGHSFCQSCLKQSNLRQCPTCRCSLVAPCQGFVLQGLIGNLKITCRNNNNNNQSFLEGEPPTQRRRRGTTTLTTTSCSPLLCHWTGKFSEWHQHAINECQLPVGRCEVKGCGFVGSLKDLREHNIESMGKHQELLLKNQMEKLQANIQEERSQMKKAILKEVTKDLNQKYDGQLKRERSQMKQTLLQEIKSEMKQQFEDKANSDAIYLMLSAFCRSWILHKPDPLFDFLVYQERKLSNRLLIGIPGPKRTPLEGGLYPLLMEWRVVQKPPRAKFPKNFHHVNVYESGTVHSRILNEDDMWSSSIGVADLMFAMQQHLGHPNPHGPAQRPAWETFFNSQDRHNGIAKETANRYAPHRFFDLAVKSFDLKGTDWTLVEAGKATSLIKQATQSQPKEPPKPSATQITELNLLCECSCCAWAFHYEGGDLRMYLGD